MKVLAWHVHGSWMTSFVHGPWQTHVPVVHDRGPNGRGRALTYVWPERAIEIPSDELQYEAFDLVVLQRPVLSGDTGIAHLAVASGRPSVTLFGPTPAKEWGPLQDPAHVTLGNRTATPRRLDALGGRSPDPALMRVGVREVTDAAHSLLG